LRESPIAPTQKILRFPETLRRLQTGERVWPLHVEMDLSDQCNLRCAWCRFADRLGEATVDLPFARSVLDQLRAVGVRAVTFSGGGEPTLCPAFATIARYAASIGLDVGIYSNGTNTRALLDAADVCEWIYVSLDAVNAAQYEAIKHKPYYDRVCESVRRLSARDCIVGVGFLITGENWRDAERMAMLAGSLGADYCQLRACAGLDDYSWVPVALPWLEHLAGPRTLIYSRRFRDLYDAWSGTYERGYTVCRGSEIVPAITADGMVWVCPNTRRLRPLGNLREEPFTAIWERRAEQHVGDDCEPTCRNHALNRTLEYVCSQHLHERFV